MAVDTMSGMKSRFSQSSGASAKGMVSGYTMPRNRYRKVARSSAGGQKRCAGADEGFHRLAQFAVCGVDEHDVGEPRRDLAATALAQDENNGQSRTGASRFHQHRNHGQLHA